MTIFMTKTLQSWYCLKESVSIYDSKQFDGPTIRQQCKRTQFNTVVKGETFSKIV